MDTRFKNVVLFTFFPRRGRGERRSSNYLDTRFKNVVLFTSPRRWRGKRRSSNYLDTRFKNVVLFTFFPSPRAGEKKKFQLFGYTI
ncbi:MAG: hypothetical protein LBR79_04680 [Oscillospiraceae bacterium]|nr:hypothetical protein [Oscillospiraceae bacterium]